MEILDSTSFLALIFKGGWIMIPIILLSVAAVYALLERIVFLHRALSVPTYWIEDINAKIIAGDSQSVLALCERKPYSIARIIKAGITKIDKPHTALKEATENAAQEEAYKLEHNLGLIGTIASAAPMLGFLGTVLGMIQAFMNMAQQTQQISPKLLSGGIYEAMITTAAGLIVGIIANLSYNYLLIRIQSATQYLEQSSRQFLELVKEYSLANKA